MRIIEINPLSNGAHRNLTCNTKALPSGWAVIPDNMETPNFPFGEVIAAEINGVMTVTNWTAGRAPVSHGIKEENKTESGTIEQLRADIDYISIMTGVEL